MTGADRLRGQVAFLREIDKLKQVGRQTPLMDGSRKENSAEHSWHIATMVLFLGEHAREKNLDELLVIKMLLVHDIVEVDAGDTFCYDREGLKDQAEREQRAADRLFGLLPADQCAEFRSLWDEFEARETAEAKFAHAIDRVQPMLHNYFTNGASWREHRVTKDMVLDRNGPIEDGSQALWDYITTLVDDAVDQGILEP
jgi:putative hydrolase of HD superfamily